MHDSIYYGYCVIVNRSLEEEQIHCLCEGHLIWIYIYIIQILAMILILLKINNLNLIMVLNDNIFSVYYKIKSSLVTINVITSFFVGVGDVLHNSYIGIYNLMMKIKLKLFVKRINLMNIVILVGMIRLILDMEFRDNSVTVWLWYYLTAIAFESVSEQVFRIEKLHYSNVYNLKYICDNRRYSLNILSCISEDNADVCYFQSNILN